ncbi:MAG: succinate dehydrogenase, hydrophobic membrane anchor protein [Gammaproteobacteria bacterium]
MSLESPLGKFIGHGSAKDGTGHWWGQKLSAVALVPLTLWFVLAVINPDLIITDLQSVRAWIAAPLNAIMLILLLIAGLYHSMLGLQVVVEDYVHGALKVITLVALQLVHVALAVAAIYSVIIISVGAG